MKPKQRSRAIAKQTQAEPALARIPRWPVFAIYLGLFIATFAVYAPVRHFDFVNYDDPDYVTGNAHVRQGFTSDGLHWAFTSTGAANWFPVTRLSHMLDYQLFGLNAGAQHLDNVLLHALAAVLLFAFLNLATGALGPSAVVAFAFALHPLHVESVAWIAERKDVLSACFWFLTLFAYVRYTQRPDRLRYLPTLAAFVLGLMSKPMIVTLPATLLLLDFWPLRRRLAWRELVVEKLPFFGLSGVVAIVTYVVQQRAGAVRTTGIIPLALRIPNALASYLVYAAKTLWPSGLAVFYPYPATAPLWEAGCAAVFLGGISYVAWQFRGSAPYLAAGWCWYLVTLLPVIGLVQVGLQARADRYMYVPMVGLLVMLAWGAAELLKRWALPVAGLALASCAVAASLQVQYWQDSETLFTHALAVTHDNYLAEHNLGSALLSVPGRLPDAITHLQAAIRLRPESVQAHSDLGLAYAKSPGRLNEAIAEYRTALRLAPESAIPHNNLGTALAKLQGHTAEALEEYRTALRLDPDYAEAHANLGALLQGTQNPDAAIAEFETALRADPKNVEAHKNLANALAATSAGVPRALAEYEAALRVAPNDAELHNGLGSVLAQTPGRLSDAIPEYQTALRLRPDYAEADNNLGLALLKADRPADAAASFQAAIKIKPDYAEAHNNLGLLLTRVPGREAKAMAHFEAAVRYKPDDAEAHFNLGVALSNQPGRMLAALAQFKEAQRLHPDPETEKVIRQLER